MLKGGMLLAAWQARRLTTDADFLVRGLAVDEQASLTRIIDIAQTAPPFDDGVRYFPETAKTGVIRAGDLYGGVRVTMDARVARASVRLRLDVSVGDPVVPDPAPISYPTLLEAHPPLHIHGYPLATVLAEKLCTAVSLGYGNSRVRDYADLWTLTGLQDVDGSELAGALRATSSHRDIRLFPLAQAIQDFSRTKQACTTSTAGSSEWTPPRCRKAWTPWSRRSSTSPIRSSPTHRRLPADGSPARGRGWTEGCDHSNKET